LKGFYFADGAKAIEQLETLGWEDFDGISLSEMRLRRKGENCVGENACGHGSCVESGCICASRAEYLADFKACVRGTPKTGLWDEIVAKETVLTERTTTTTTTTTTTATTSTRSQKNEEYEQACSKECGEHGRCVVQYGAEGTG
jgi:hypothetical protein